jgi:hypothetical protein
MKKNLFIVLVILVMFLAHGKVLTAAAGGGQINTCSIVCAGNDVMCEGSNANCGGTISNEKIETHNSVNAYGDRINWGSLNMLQKEEGFSFVSLGNIARNKDYSLQLPAVDTKKVVQIIPTEGFFAYKKMDILFVSFDLQNLPSYLNNKKFELVRKDLNLKKKRSNLFRYVVKLYRRTGDEKDWVEIQKKGAVLSAVEPSVLKTNITISPSAVVTIPAMEQFNKSGETVFTKAQPVDCGAIL